MEAVEEEDDTDDSKGERVEEAPTSSLRIIGFPSFVILRPNASHGRQKAEGEKRFISDASAHFL
jgi:hypothetical protein